MERRHFRNGSYIDDVKELRHLDLIFKFDNDLITWVEDDGINNETSVNVGIKETHE